MVNIDSTSGSQQEGDGAQPGAGGRRYRKKDDKRGSQQSGDSSNSSSLREKEINQSEVDIQRIKLNRLSNYEVDDVKMANVFGPKTDDKQSVSSSMRLNPLYDQNGTVEVSSDQAQFAKNADTASQDSGSSAVQSGKSKKGTYKRPKKGVDDEDEDGLPAIGNQEPKINYSKNFRFGKPENGVQNGAPGVKKLTTFGVVMPSRVKQNTIPKNQLVAAGGVSQYAIGEQNGKSKSDVEAASRRHEIRRRWRYVIILILIILFFGLILTVVLYFATRAP